MAHQSLIDVNIIDALGLSALSDEDRQHVLSQITTLAQKSLMLRLMNVLSDDDQEILDALIAEKGLDSSDVKAFLVARVLNLDEIIAEEIEKIKAGLISTITGVSV